MTSSSTDFARLRLGGRGIDRVEFTDIAGATTIGFPLYDGHGNVRGMLQRSGSGYSTGNWRTYDVWGSVRSGGSSGDPDQGYCGSLGHVEDDETGLIYMRARYYEPGTGRFVSEDPAMDGGNWFVYCRNEPLNNVDSDGLFVDSLVAIWAIAGVLGILTGLDGLVQAANGQEALIIFARTATYVKDSAQLEEAWGEFMTAWNKSPIASLDANGDILFAMNMLSCLFGFSLSGLSNGLTEGALVLQIHTLGLGYGIRLTWYLADIQS